MFCRLGLRLIAGALPEGDKGALRILFEQLKREPGPFLSASELEEALVNKGQKIRKLELKQMLRDISVNNTGKISFLDFTAANMRVSSSLSTLEDSLSWFA